MIMMILSDGISRDWLLEDIRIVLDWLDEQSLNVTYRIIVDWFWDIEFMLNYLYIRVLEYGADMDF